MAIPEACGLWIQQRLEEEIQESGNTIESVRAIAKAVTDEVNRVFETNVNPETIRSIARRIKGGSIDPPATTSCNDNKNNGVQGGASITPKEAVPMVKEKIEKGKSKKAAVKEVSKETGLKENSVKSAHQRAEAKKKTPAPFSPSADSVMSKDFRSAYDTFIKEVSQAKKDNWESTSKEAILQCINTINFYLGE